MALSFIPRRIGASDGHYARKYHLGLDANMWTISWLPDRLVTYEQALAAMLLSDSISTWSLAEQRQRASLLDAWASEIDATLESIIARVHRMPTPTALHCPVCVDEACRFPSRPSSTPQCHAAYQTGDWIAYYKWVADHLSCDELVAPIDPAPRQLATWRELASRYRDEALALALALSNESVNP